MQPRHGVEAGADASGYSPTRPAYGFIAGVHRADRPVRAGDSSRTRGQSDRSGRDGTPVDGGTARPDRARPPSRDLGGCRHDLDRPARRAGSCHPRTAPHGSPRHSRCAPARVARPGDGTTHAHDHGRRRRTRLVHRGRAGGHHPVPDAGGRASPTPCPSRCRRSPEPSCHDPIPPPSSPDLSDSGRALASPGSDNSAKRGGLLSRRGLLGSAGAGAAVALAGAGAMAANGRTLAASGPAWSTVDFHGTRQAGITTAAQDRLHFAAFDVLPSATRDDLVQLLKDWTAAAARMTSGDGAGPVGPLSGSYKHAGRHRRGHRAGPGQPDHHVRLRSHPVPGRRRRRPVRAGRPPARRAHPAPALPRRQARPVRQRR